MRRLLSCLLLFPGIVTAQAAKYDYIAQKAPYANPTPPLLTAQSLPRLGSTMRLEVPLSWRQRNRVGADYVLATGLGNPDVAVSGLGGFLFSSAQVLIATPMSPLGIPGKTTLSFSIPLSRQLVGVSFYQQILEATAPAPARLRLSRGGHGVIGL